MRNDVDRAAHAVCEAANLVIENNYAPRVHYDLIRWKQLQDAINIWRQEQAAHRDDAHVCRHWLGTENSGILTCSECGKVVDCRFNVCLCGTHGIALCPFHGKQESPAPAPLECGICGRPWTADQTGHFHSQKAVDTAAPAHALLEEENRKLLAQQLHHMNRIESLEQENDVLTDAVVLALDFLQPNGDDPCQCCGMFDEEGHPDYCVVPHLRKALKHHA